MNLVDLLIWAVLLLFVAKGLWKGLVKEVCSLLGLLVGAWGAFRYDQSLAEAIRPAINLPHGIAALLSFLFIFILLALLFYLLGYLLTVVCKIMLMGWLNRIGGALFGLLAGAFVLSLALYFAVNGPTPARLKGMVSRSGTAKAFVQTGGGIVSGWEARAGSHR